ncbi:MAG: copper chaperone PCu(A)C [Proteobacteria bacterium]|nr:copper chaperone PCu(A)C [Pseudomonadota bacterium]
MKLFVPLVAAMVLSAGSVAMAKAPAIEVVRPWSRPAVAGTTGIGYMTLVNHGHAADALEKVESPIAARVEMHASTMAGGVMTMERKDRVPVPAGGETTFGPGAYHLMLIGLTRTLKPGDEAPATLTFASGARVKVKFLVSAGMGPPAARR